MRKVEQTLADMNKFEQDFKNLKDSLVTKLLGGPAVKAVEKSDKIVVNGVELNQNKRK